MFKGNDSSGDVCRFCGSFMSWHSSMPGGRCAPQAAYLGAKMALEEAEEDLRPYPKRWKRCFDCEKKDARIAELEAKVKELLISGQPSYWSVEMSKKESWNAALEEAAEVAEAGPPWNICHKDDREKTAARIRALKK